MADIIALQLGRIGARVSARQGVPLSYDEAVVRLIAARCNEPESGGRMIDAILTNTLLPDISGGLLTRMLDGRPVERVHIGVDSAAFTYSFDVTPLTDAQCNGGQTRRRNRIARNKIAPPAR
jgi:type VI secretion system protein VasG